jgi:biopolymer transport protein ExbD
MNVTPLIDVLLVLIIIFMVVVIEQRPTGLTAEVPQPAPPTTKNIPRPDRTIVIHVHHTKPEGKSSEHPQVTVNEESVEWDRLRERLRDIFSIRVERIAFIEADDDIDDRGREACAHNGIARVVAGFPSSARVVTGLCPVKRGKAPLPHNLNSAPGS